MNRNISQAAKVLGIDPALVKRWTILFEEHLSTGAKPPKGSPRMFTESDLLVLIFVASRWEENPDIEAIKIGLNCEDHFEEPFRELLYRHTPLLQEPPEDLDETWRHGILLCGAGAHEYLELARNYRRVAESMLDAALEKDEVRDRAYPVLFAYRHTLELYLKIIGEIDEITHSLARCVRLVEKRHREKLPGGALPEPMRGWILELETIDPAGTTFRYPDQGVGLKQYFEKWFDFLQFKFAMKHVFDVLDQAILRSGINGQPAQKRRR